MSMLKIVGDNIPNMPWCEPADEKQVVWRHPNNPILGRNIGGRCARTYNSAVVPWKGGFAGVFRADNFDGVALLHKGFSNDGIHWDIDPEPINWINEAGEPYPMSFDYDPRVTVIDGTAYVVWCANFSGPCLGVGKTDDFETFVRLPNATTPYNRNGVLFPRKINGRYVMLTRPSDNGHTAFGNIYLSESPDMVFWGMHKKVMTRGNLWQSLKIGSGSVPIETSEGWLMFYHGVSQTCNGYVYSFGAVLLDLENPSVVKYRTRDALISPEMDYETVGFVPNVCFPCATLCDAETGRIAIYYGAADTHVAMAFTQADKLVEYLKANSLLVSGDDRIEC